MSNTTAKDAFGFDALSTYTYDGLGINALPYSEKYKKGIRENTTGKWGTIAIVANCPDCDFYYKKQEFIPPDNGYELTEEIERKESPNAECKSKNYTVTMVEKDTVRYPSNAPIPKRQEKYRVLTIDGKCSCGSKQGYDKEEWHFQPGTTWTPKKHNQPCPDCGKEYYINWTEEQRTYL